MARFDVYKNAGQRSETAPFLLDVQSDHLGALATRVVVPLRRVDTFAAVKLPQDLTPTFLIDGTEYFFDAPKLAAVPRRELGNAILSMRQQQSRIINALDRLFGGF